MTIATKELFYTGQKNDTDMNKKERIAFIKAKVKSINNELIYDLGYSISDVEIFWKGVLLEQKRKADV